MVIKVDSLRKTLFFISYYIFMFFSLLLSTFYSVYFSKYYTLLMFLCVSILIFSELFMKKIHLKDILFILLCLIMSFIIISHDNSIGLFPFFFFIYCGRNYDFKEISKHTIIISMIVLALVIISAKIGIIYNYVSYGMRIRNYLGFRYALFPSMIVFNCFLLDLYNNKFSIKRSFLWLILTFVIYYYTKSNLSFILSLIAFIVVFIYNFKHTIFNNEIIRLCLTYSFIICSFFSFFAIYKYNQYNSVMYEVNTILEGRISLAKESLSVYPVNLFGYDVQYYGNGLDENGNKNTQSYFYVDCMYLNILERYGLIFFSILLILLTKSCINIEKDGNILLLLMLMLVAVHGIIDDLGFNLKYNTFWFVISFYLFNINFYKKREVKAK